MDTDENQGPQILYEQPGFQSTADVNTTTH